MAHEKETIEILNDLIEINNDRITDYERAIKELKEEDEDLNVVFQAMIDQSRNARMALGKEVQVLGGTMDTSTTASGKIYRAWMDVKAVFTRHNRQTVLANCHTGEHAALKAYSTALEDEHLPAYLREIIYDQEQDLKDSHEEIKALNQQEV